MPTYESPQAFQRAYKKLTPDQQRLFRAALQKFVAALKAGEPFPPELRVKSVRRARSISLMEMTWAADGRATWTYGPEKTPGEPHIVWVSIGTHAILDS